MHGIVLILIIPTGARLYSHRCGADYGVIIQEAEAENSWSSKIEGTDETIDCRERQDRNLLMSVFIVSGQILQVNAKSVDPQDCKRLETFYYYFYY